MSADITDADFVARSTSEALANDEAALREAEAQAIAEINRIKAAVAEKGDNLSAYEDYELYDVPGVGRYVIMRDRGWKPLVNIIGNDKDQRSIVANIDFSPKLYPTFDAVIGDHFQSPYLLDPMDDKFMSFKSLRDNLAAVRNFLMESYFAHTPEGITDEKARASLEEIAAFVGDGLYNNWLFLGVVPNHDPRKPFIDLEHARKPNGVGAQYIYEKILEQQRHSSWLRPFDAVLALFGGKKHEWHLPPAEATGFKHANLAVAGIDGASLKAQLASATGALNDINAKLAEVRDRRALTDVANDLDAMGNQLIYTATHMDGVAQLSDPVRRDAVDIAHEILRKLKIGIGNVGLLDGLRMKPTDDMAAFGSIKGVALVYERLLAWARANNDSGVFQHPAVLAATQAIGQLGYQAKREAMRMAAVGKNTALVEAIGEQLKRVPQAYASASDSNFGALFDKIASGMNTIINRTQQVTVGGAKVGHSLENAQGMMSAPPTAGIANQVNAAEAIRRNAQALEANIQAQQAAIHSQMAAQARQQQNQQGQQATTQPAPRGSGSVGRNPFAATQAARAQRQAAVSSTTSKPATLQNAMQQQQAARNADAAAALQHQEEQRHQQEALMREQQRLQYQAQMQKAAAKAQEAIVKAQNSARAAKAQAAAQTIPTDMLKSFQAATSTKGLTTQTITGGKPIDPKSIRQSMDAKAAAAATPTAPPADKPVVATGNPELDKYMAPLPQQPGIQPNRGGRGY